MEIITYPLQYNGNKWWLLISFILPWVGCYLLLLNLAVRINGTWYSLRYRGHKGWLLFWLIVFFPVGLILSVVNGFDLIGKPA